MPLALPFVPDVRETALALSAAKQRNALEITLATGATRIRTNYYIRDPINIEEGFVIIQVFHKGPPL